MTSSSAALLEEAVRLHDRGALDEAASRYARVLAADPANVDAMFRLGRAHCQQGRFAEGIELFRKVIEIKPDHAEAHNLLGMALDRLGRPLEALGCFDRATACDPAFADAWANKADSLSNLGRFAEAIKTYDRALAIRPTLAAAWSNRGGALHSAQQYQRAIESFDRAIECDPSFAEAHANRATTLKKLGRFEDALASLDKAIAANADSARLQLERGALLRELIRHEEALDSIDQALALDPSLAAGHVDRGVVLRELNRPEQALGSIDRALALNSSSVATHRLRTLTLADLDRPEEAYASIDRAFALDPSAPDNYSVRATVNHFFGRFAEARADHERALELAPDNDQFAVKLAAIRMLQGEWREAWPIFDRREFTQNASPASSIRLWLGEPLKRKRLLLACRYRESEIIRFSRFASFVAEHGIHVTLICPPPLAPLLRSLAGTVEVITRPVDLDPAFARWLPLMSVPRVLGVTPDTVPAKVPYLAAEPERTAAWATRLEGQGFKIGICWQDDSTFGKPWLRSARLSEFAPLAEIPGVRLISLQKSFDRDEVAKVGFYDRIETPLQGIDLNADALLDTAAIIMNLDLVVSVDTIPAHLAGALARPVFTALPFVPAWSWMLDREDTPWYPTMRLFRQRERGDWRGVFERIAAAVRERASGA